MTRQEKAMLRQKVYVALDQNDPDTANQYMALLCTKEPLRRQRSWSKDETDFLMYHIDAQGYEKGIINVAEKLDRSILSVKAKYSSMLKKGKLSKSVE